MDIKDKPQFKLRAKTQTVTGNEGQTGQRFSLAELNRLADQPEGTFYRPVKKQISIRLDADILAWFQAQPGKYQTLINRACRIFMRLHQLVR